MEPAVTASVVGVLAVARASVGCKRAPRHSTSSDDRPGQVEAFEPHSSPTSPPDRTRHAPIPPTGTVARERSPRPRGARRRRWPAGGSPRIPARRSIARARARPRPLRASTAPPATASSGNGDEQVARAHELRAAARRCIEPRIRAPAAGPHLRGHHRGLRADAVYQTISDPRGSLGGDRIPAGAAAQPASRLADAAAGRAADPRPRGSCHDRRNRPCVRGPPSGLDSALAVAARCVAALLGLLLADRRLGRSTPSRTALPTWRASCPAADDVPGRADLPRRSSTR